MCRNIDERLFAIFTEGEKARLCNNIRRKDEQEIKSGISTFYGENGKEKETVEHLFSHSHQPKILFYSSNQTSMVSINL